MLRWPNTKCLICCIKLTDTAVKLSFESLTKGGEGHSNEAIYIDQELWISDCHKLGLTPHPQPIFFESTRFRWLSDSRSKLLGTPTLNKCEYTYPNIYSLHFKLVFVLVLRFFLSISKWMITNLDIYRKHIYQLLYKPIKRLKRILIWNRWSTFFFLFISIVHSGHCSHWHCHPWWCVTHYYSIIAAKWLN
jgi:hypothetical protein